MKKFVKLLLPKILLILAIVTILAFIITPPFLVYQGKYKIYKETADVEATKYAIVFGAGVMPNGHPTDMLEDRLLTAVDLYNNQKIEKIIVSGDNRTTHYNEPQAMYLYLIDQGIPENAIVMDFAGRRTYDTCYRAKEIFSIDKAILISQGYHLPRAIYLCNHFGVESTGFSATKRVYEGEFEYEIREILALYQSILDIYVTKPTPVLGDKIEIL